MNKGNRTASVRGAWRYTSMTATERAELARSLANARWSKSREGKKTHDEPDESNVEN